MIRWYSPNCQIRSRGRRSTPQHQKWPHGLLQVSSQPHKSGVYTLMPSKLAEVLDIPTPRILAWSAQKANPVGAEYILEERASGQPLGALWQDWNKLPLVNRFGIIRQLVNMERKLAETTFQLCGSIYFKEDFPQGDDMKLSGTCTISPSTLGRYALGPMVGIDFWQGPKASMDLDRGPCEYLC